ncbi:hypothetical protein ACFVAJ_17755 [Agromyces sp. NPDC057679]|uniref:hypothetical protein n=1 Tax=Agromyces sp. NPDC057679 TaxID=3346207 RepID=UPI0036708F9B
MTPALAILVIVSVGIGTAGIFVAIGRYLMHPSFTRMETRRCRNCKEQITWEPGRADDAKERLRDHAKHCLH